MTCVRFEDNGHPRAYAVFITDGKVIDGRYAVQTDTCDAQTYAAFDAMGPTRAGGLGPVYGVLWSGLNLRPHRMAKARTCIGRNSSGSLATLAAIRWR